MYIKRHLETTIEKLSGCCKVTSGYWAASGRKDDFAAQAGRRQQDLCDDGRYQRAQLGNDGTGAVSAAV